jgi:hypothetical protein
MTYVTFGPGGDFYLHLERRLAAAGRMTATGRFDGDVWSRYLAIVEREIVVPRERLRPNAGFYRDLGAG